MSRIRGDVRILSNEVVEWRMPDLDAPEMENLSEYYSPEFVIGGERYILLISPKYFGHIICVVPLKVYLGPQTVQFTVALKASNGQKECETSKMVFEKWNLSYCFKQISLLSREQYKRRKSELCISGSITIVCSIAILPANSLAEDLCKKFNELSEELYTCKADKENISKEKLHLEDDLKAMRENLESITNELNHLRKKYDDTQIMLESTVKGKDELDVCKVDKVTRESWDDRPLCEAFKEVLLNGLNYDLTLKMGYKELRAHQDILRARSEVFKSMLSHDTQEKKSSIIDIPDCDPEAMEQFLCYIYTGRVDSLEESNMLSLYYIADKYDMRGLKEKCSSFIKESISSLNFCKVIQLALNHSDHTLLEQATDYFTDNMLDIMRTVEWQMFLKDNTTVANELTIKSVEKLKTVKM